MRTYYSPNSGVDKLTFITAGSDLCQNLDTDNDNDNDASGNYKGSSSGGGLSGAAIAGIVIAGIVVVAIVAILLVYVVKRGAEAGGAASAVSTCSNIGIGNSSSSNEPVPKF